MTVTEWKERTDIISNVVVTLAALAGGLWAVFRFWRERTDEAALDLTVSHRSSPLGKNHLVAITLELANKGKTRIQAKTKRTETDFAFDDTVEKLHHPCSLQIGKFKTPDQSSPVRIDWFEAGQVVENVPGLQPEINLLSEYEDPENNNIIDFWLEPGETYRLEAPLILPEGLYLGKVTFVGAGGDSNFWSQVFSFAVPVKS
jgi:hypothetical protein